MATSKANSSIGGKQYVTRAVSQTETVFNDESLGSSILKGLASLRDEGRFFDVALEVEDQKIQAHRVVLGAFSPYFNSMFRPDMVESKMDTIRLPNLSADIVRQLIDFAYTATINISGESVQELLIAADFLSVLSVHKACCVFMRDNLDVTNCMQVLQFAADAGLVELRNSAFRFSCHYFGSACREEGFLQVMPETVVELLQSDRLCVLASGFPIKPCDQELTVLKAVVRYLSAAEPPVDISTWLPVMLTNIRLSLLDKDVLKQGEHYLSELSLPDKEKCQASQMFKEAVAVKRNKKKSSNQKWNTRRIIAPTNVRTGEKFASGGELRNVVSHFSQDVEKWIRKNRFIYVSGLKLWIRRWDGRPVLGGLCVVYSDGHTEEHGQCDCSENYQFTCEDKERITDAKVNAGWLIDSLTFTTNIGNTYGPYGGPGGSPRRASPLTTDGSFYLAGVTGHVVKDQGSKAITNLQFVWAAFMFEAQDDEELVQLFRDNLAYDMDEAIDW